MFAVVVALQGDHRAAYWSMSLLGELSAERHQRRRFFAATGAKVLQEQAVSPVYLLMPEVPGATGEIGSGGLDTASLGSVITKDGTQLDVRPSARFFAARKDDGNPVTDRSVLLSSTTRRSLQAETSM